jgi:hypothetical protein
MENFTKIIQKMYLLHLIMRIGVIFSLSLPIRLRSVKLFLIY